MNQVVPPPPLPQSAAVAAAAARRTSLLNGNESENSVLERGDVEAELIADLNHLPLGGMESPHHGAGGIGSSPYGFPLGLGLTPGLRSVGLGALQLPSSACSGELQRYSSASVELQNERETALHFALHVASPGPNGNRCVTPYRREGVRVVCGSGCCCVVTGFGWCAPERATKEPITIET